MPTYTGTSGADNFTANTTENWTIDGKGGADTLTGNAGNDTFIGSWGNDILDGQDGDDTFLQGLNQGVDIFIGGAGYDIIKATTDNVKIGIRSMSGIEEVSADSHNNVSIIGSIDADTLDFSNVKLTGIVMIYGNQGADTITGTAGTDYINGGVDDDIINAGGGDDIIFFSYAGGLNAVNGGAGYDILQATNENVYIGLSSYTAIEEISAGGFGGVTIRGSAGDDILDFSKITLTGIAAIVGYGGNDTIIGTAQDDTIIGNFGDDTLKGGVGSDIIDGGGGTDLMDGGMGDDIFLVSLGAGVNTYKGGAGYDMISGNADNAIIRVGVGLISGIEEINSGGWSNVTIAGAPGIADDIINLSGITMSDGDIAGIYGNDGNDSITGSTIGDFIYGGIGEDVLKGLAGDDTIDGGGGIDNIDGGAGFDTIYGQKGDDTILGGFGDDIIDGGDGNDMINGGGGNDTLTGGIGDDHFLVSLSGGTDDFDGGDGIDIIAATQNNVAIGIRSLIDIEQINGGGFANVTIVGTADSDLLDFSAVTMTGIKSIGGGTGDDQITGTSGDDTILGLNGADILDGGNGADILSGGVGLDTLTGGAGADIFKDSIANLKGDTILDFTAEDKIQISGVANPAAMTFAYAAGVLSIDPDGAGAVKAFAINLPGDFVSSDFHAVSDGMGGAFVSVF